MGKFQGFDIGRINVGFETFWCGCSCWRGWWRGVMWREWRWWRRIDHPSSIWTCWLTGYRGKSRRNEQRWKSIKAEVSFFTRLGSFPSLDSARTWFHTVSDLYSPNRSRIEQQQFESRVVVFRWADLSGRVFVRSDENNSRKRLYLDEQRNERCVDR